MAGQQQNPQPPASRRPFGPVNDALQTIRTWHTAGCKDDSSAVPIRYDPSTGRPATIHPWRDYPDGVPVYADVNDVSSEFCLVEVQGADKDQRLKQARVHWSLRSFVATRPQPKTIVDQIAAAQKNAARGTMGGARAGSTRASKSTKGTSNKGKSASKAKKTKTTTKETKTKANEEDSEETKGEGKPRGGGDSKGKGRGKGKA